MAPKLKPIWICETCQHREARDEPIHVKANAGPRMGCPYCRMRNKGKHRVGESQVRAVPMARAVR